MSDKLAVLSAKITADLIDMMGKHDVSENVRPWAAASPDQGAPYNVMTGKAYKGMNPIILCMEGRSTSGWATCLQWNELGARIKAGEHGTTAIKWVEAYESKDKAAGPDETRAPGRMFPVPFTLFNAEQVNGAPPLNTPPVTWDPIERVEALIVASGAFIEHRNSDAAFYSQGADKIVMPLRSQFPGAAEWAGVLCHELGHWTGAKSRLNRDFGGFQSPERAREELRAELSAAFTCAELGLTTPKMDVQHAVYLKSWITLLQNDPKELLRAAADAQRMSTMVLSFDRYKHLSEERDQARSMSHLAVKKEAKQNEGRSSKYKSKTPTKTHEQQAEMSR